MKHQRNLLNSTNKFGVANRLFQNEGVLLTKKDFVQNFEKNFK